MSLPFPETPRLRLLWRTPPELAFMKSFQKPLGSVCLDFWTYLTDRPRTLSARYLLRLNPGSYYSY